jgi:hypothetical protein
MTINYPALDERGFLKRYLEISNMILPEEQRLVPSEIDLMIEFALLPEKFKHQRFGSLAKDKVIEYVEESVDKKLTKLNINNKLYSLLDKKFLHRDIDKVIYMPKHFLYALDTFRKEQNFVVSIVFPLAINEEEENRPNSL